ncbi:MAG: NADP-specific glutamate dehydrogenase, partial [Oscillospiraceae bacterium]
MTMKNRYISSVYDTVCRRNANETEFQQAVFEVLESLEPVIESNPIYEKLAIL